MGLDSPVKITCKGALDPFSNFRFKFQNNGLEKATKEKFFTKPWFKAFPTKNHMLLVWFTGRTISDTIQS